MLKYIDLVTSSRKSLKEAGIESYILDSDIIIQTAFNISKEELFLNHNNNIPTEEYIKKYDIFQAMLARRIKREPISHILGKREFWSLEFHVNQHTLDPRADTETLISAVLSSFKDKNKPLEILDLGTGSGCILLSLLKEFKHSHGIGIDKMLQTALVANKNCDNLYLKKKCNFIVSKWMSALDKKFDLIVSNPPYIESKEISQLSEEVKNFDPLPALDGGDDGLICYKEIAQNIRNYLKKDGLLFLEIGQNQESDIINIFDENGLTHVNYYQDINKITRCLSFKQAI